MKIYRLSMLLLCIFMLSSFVFGQDRPEHVIIISIDGFLPDYYTQPEKTGVKVPNIVELKNKGAYADGVEGVYPTITYPSHTTMVTGARPGTHGVVQNRIFESPSIKHTRDWYWNASSVKIETLYTAAKKKGLTTAAVWWPVTVGGDITYNVPEVWDPNIKEAHHNWAKAIEASTPGIIDKALAADDIKTLSMDEIRVKIASYILTTHKPNLLLLHIAEMDDAHHKYGPRAPEALKAAEHSDLMVGKILEATKKAGTYDKTTFFIVSDHGFAAINKKYGPNVDLVDAKLISLDEKGNAVDWKASAWPSGGSCAIMLKDASDNEVAKKVINLFNGIAARKDSPIKKVIYGEEKKKLGAVPEALLMLEGADGYSFDWYYKGKAIQDSGSSYKGTHGQLPTDPRLRASLVASGPGIRVGAQLPLTKMIDLAPTVASLLGLDLSKAEGKAIKKILK